MEAKDWNLLLRRIENGECVPILGPGICTELLIPPSHIALTWAREHGYPLPETEDLARVSQYLAVEEYDLYPKDEIKRLLKETEQPDFSNVKQPHAILAALDLPIYITTNYYDFMYRALKAAKKEPAWEIARWNPLLSGKEAPLAGGFEPRPATPLVYHLLGHYEHPESLVLTEDDYIDFLVNISSERFPLPLRIRQALSEASLLFIGYSPADWDFRILFRGLINPTHSELRRLSVTVQVPPLPEDVSESVRNQVEGYLNAYMRTIDADMHVYWGSADDFLQELRRRRQGETMDAAAGEEAGARIDQVRLFRGINQYFDKEDLLNIAFELEIDADNLPPAKNSFARELIIELKQRRRLAELLALCRRERPQVTWQ